MTVVFFDRMWRSALDADINWVTGRPSAGWLAEAQRAGAAVGTTVALIAGVVVAVVLLAGPRLSPGAADPAPRPPAEARPPAATTIPPMRIPPPLALAMACGTVEHAAQMPCLSYLAGVSQETLDGLGFFCANGDGDPAACRARLLAVQLRPPAP